MSANTVKSATSGATPKARAETIYGNVVSAAKAEKIEVSGFLEMVRR
jgi:hypothetical protein